MEILTPDPTMFRLPAGTAPACYAETQPEYLTLPSLKTPDGRVISQWKPERHELDALNRGEPITLILHTFNQPLQPIILAVGGLDLT